MLRVSEEGFYSILREAEAAEEIFSREAFIGSSKKARLAEAKTMELCELLQHIRESAHEILFSPLSFE